MTAGDVLIVIGRQFGSGGRALGRELSLRLSVPFYDKELLSEAARQFGISLPVFERHDERKPSLLRTVVENAFGNSPVNVPAEETTSQKIYTLQSHVIARLADQGGAVFVGRTADYVLRDNPRLLSVFVHSDEDAKCRRIIRRGDCDSESQARELARRKDRLRQSYYNYYTGRQWGNASNYHLCIHLGKTGLSVAADIVTQAACALADMQRQRVQ